MLMPCSLARLWDWVRHRGAGLHCEPGGRCWPGRGGRHPRVWPRADQRGALHWAGLLLGARGPHGDPAD
eukprot:scaffold229557_cov51-Prasinocladus_malaysianus.AAC.1